MPDLMEFIDLLLLETKYLYLLDKLSLYVIAHFSQ